MLKQKMPILHAPDSLEARRRYSRMLREDISAQLANAIYESIKLRSPPKDYEQFRFIKFYG